jgi:hypothetical protein
MNFELNVELGTAADVKFGEASIFDVYIEAADDLPFELPVQQYLEEMTCGIHGYHNAEGSAPKPSGKARGNWQRMKCVLETDAAVEVVRALFGLAVGVVLSRASEDAVAELREYLARSWSLVVLEARKKANDGGHGTLESRLETQDWLLRSLPIVMVQCIYRLLVDAFAEDKSQLAHFSDELLEKLTNVVTYEVCGFKLNPRTWKKERKRVFTQGVIDNPFVNQTNALKSQARMHNLENNSKGSHPLVFGRQDGLPLDETQLEHVMTNRYLAQQKANEGGLRSTAFEPLEVPSELSVDRYAGIAQVGDQLLQRHLQELSPDKTLAPSIVMDTKMERPDSGGNGGCPSEGDPDSPTKMRTSLTGKDFMRMRREAEQAEKRRREDMLQARILDEPLPSHICERSLCTSWVSPITDRLVPVERDRQGLCKRACDSRNIKMELPSVMHSHSEPTLSSSVKLPKIEKHGCGHDLGDSATSAPFNPIATEKKRYTITMEPPGSLKNAVVIGRLQEHIHCFNSKSFGAFSKEYDISTGVKKSRMDPTAMRQAENTYVSSLHALVGPARQPALKMFDSPERLAKRREKRAR